jgi:hypothetical protein
MAQFLTRAKFRRAEFDDSSSNGEEVQIGCSCMIWKGRVTAVERLCFSRMVVSTILFIVCDLDISRKCVDAITSETRQLFLFIVAVNISVTDKAPSCLGIDGHRHLHRSGNHCRWHVSEVRSRWPFSVGNCRISDRSEGHRPLHRLVGGCRISSHSEVR